MKEETRTSTHKDCHLYPTDKALLVWFFGDFRCGVWLLIVLLVTYINRYRGVSHTEGGRRKDTS